MKRMILSLTVVSIGLGLFLACRQEYRGALFPKADERAGKWGYADTAGRAILAPQWDEAGVFSEGLAAVRLNGKYGYIDRKGRDVIAYRYDGAEDFLDSLAKVSLNAKFGYIDKTGQEIIPVKYDSVTFSGRLTLVKLDGKYGLLDAAGKEITPFYEAFGLFAEGLASVGADGRYGYIDKGGKEVIPRIYDAASAFEGDLAAVRKDGKCGLIDKEGNEIFPCKYENIKRHGDLFTVEINGKESLLDRNGKAPDRLSGTMALKIAHRYVPTGRTMDVNGIQVSIAKNATSSFEFEDSRGFILKYSRLIVDGKRILATEIKKATGLSDYNRVVFVTKRSGNYTQGITLSDGYTMAYNLEKGTLTAVDTK